MTEKTEGVVEPQGTDAELTDASVEETSTTETPELSWEDEKKKIIAESRKWEARAKENVALATKWKEHEDSFKTEEQKRLEELEAYKREKVAAELETLRYKVATEKNIPSSAIALLNGTNEEEIISKAEAIVSLLSAQTKSPAPVTTQGKGNSQQEVSGDTLKDFFEENLF